MRNIPTAQHIIHGKDLTGKTSIVTGASSGIGIETVKCLARVGSRVILASRDTGKGDQVRTTILEQLATERTSQATNDKAIATGEILVMQLDLADLGSIKQFADSVLQNEQRIDLLINNAGIMAVPLSYTKSGFEMQMGTNHLGHFYLTNLLLPKLQAQVFPSRIVNLTSSFHKDGRLDRGLDDMFFKKRSYDKWTSYGNSKLANILHAKELSKRYSGDKKIQVFCVHPGIIRTAITRELGFMGVVLRSGVFASVIKLFGEWKTIEQGAATTLYAATSSDLEGHSGAYLANCKIERTRISAAEDMELALKLWEKSQQLIDEATAAK